MENRINQIIGLEDGNKYIVVKQATYKGDNYYVVVGLADDEETLLEDYKILHEVEYEGNVCVEEVIDAELIKLVCKYVGLES